MRVPRPTRVRRAAVLLALVSMLVSGCHVVAGTPTWPGAKLSQVTLTAADFPDGVLFRDIEEDPGAPDGTGEAPTMMTRPEGCSNGLTNVIASSAERGPGSAAKYEVIYDGARIVMTVLSWPLDLEALQATAQRCEHFFVLFDNTSRGIPMTTTALPSEHDNELLYQQTMTLDAVDASVYMGFANIGQMSVFGAAFPLEDTTVEARADLPNTFLDIFDRQTERVRQL
ncbi:hypothetical protein [Mycolicibacterium brumae]|nr:hypothetical protein [Mycolicibacterium brumae]UWW08141.1 hypothetical protein L2Z93_001184 [Mycolicibacterium brumae]